jgi:DNA repair protein RadC
MTDLIADLPRDDRPRERLLEHGAATLSDAELLAILLGSGTRGKNAIQLARELLREGVADLGRRDVRHIARLRGVGLAKAARIAAAFDLSRRIVAIERAEPQPFDGERAGAMLVRTHSHHRQEHLGAFFLDSRHRLLHQRDIFVGTINSALVSTRDIIRFALEENAVAVVLFHNHPSGNPNPSAEDLVFTRKLRDSLHLVDIELTDHLVVGATSFCSMRQKGQI